MADRVIIVDVRRGPELVERVEIAQMAGRAGRSHLNTGKTAFVDVVVPENDLSEAQEIIDSLDESEVFSVFDNVRDLAFQLLPEINNGNVRTEEQAREWLSRSFYCFLGGEVDILDSVFDYLIKKEAVYLGRGGDFFITPIGSLSSLFYFHPEDLLGWKNNFEEIFDRGIEESDVAVAWALSSVESQMNYFTNYNLKDIFSLYDDQVRGLGLGTFAGTMSSGVCWWWNLGGPPVKGLKPEALSKRKDFDRICLVLNKINKFCKWEMDDFFENLYDRIRHRVPYGVASFFKIENMSKEIAYELYNLGIKSIEEIECSFSLIEGSCEKRVLNVLNKFFGKIS